MNMQQIRAIARELGVRSAKVNKPELIRAIQRAEGNFDCFGQGADSCSQAECLWREDCVVPEAKKKKAAIAA